jgi:hypothetical protein
MFDVELSLVERASGDSVKADTSSTVILRRDYQELRALQSGLISYLTSLKVTYTDGHGAPPRVSRGRRLGRSQGARSYLYVLVSVARPQKDVLLPQLPSYQEETTDADMAERLVDYLLQLLQLPEVTSSQHFLDLLHDHDVVGGAECAGVVPVSPFSRFFFF